MRKPHKKSRLGCLTCKRRKVKCDEVRPECGKCVRFGVSCDFSPIPPKLAEDNLRAPSTSRRGRPRSDWASWAEQIRVTSAGNPPNGCETSGQRLNVNDLELFYNYMMNTAPSLGNENRLWSEGAPQLGFQHHCILDLMLALSSYQLARTRPAESAKFLQLAEQHSTAALQAATIFLRHLEPQNSPALYIISVLVCYTAFSQGPSPGNLLLVAQDGQVSWLSLLRGVRLVVETGGWSSIFSGILLKYLPQPGEEETQKDTEPTLPVGEIEDWRASLNDISDLIDICSEQSLKEAYRHELRVLTECFESTFGRGHHARSKIDGKMQTVISWIYQLKDPFVEGLHKKDPVALIILGHFCVLLHTLERYWIIEGWPVHIMDEILETSKASRKWLAFPVKYLKGRRTSTVASSSPKSWITV